MRHVILGNGPAGVIAAETIRKHAPNDAILLVGDEPEPPYSRMAIPYLLMNQISEAGTHLRKDAGHFARQRIDLEHARATGVDTEARVVRFADGRSVPFDALLLATGAAPVRPPMPGFDLQSVLACWTLADARRIMAIAVPGARVVQIGAGFIGCIILEALAARGVSLAVVETGDRMDILMDDLVDVFTAGVRQIGNALIEPTSVNPGELEASGAIYRAEVIEFARTTIREGRS